MGSELTDAVYALARASRVLESHLVEMTMPQLRILRLVAQAPDRASRIAAWAAVSRPSLTGLLDGLEGRGWIRRTEVAGDRRGVGLEITAGGRSALAKEERALSVQLTGVLDLLEPAERKRALAGLAALGTALERWHATRTSPATDVSR